jgi:F-type H+-transporting ATPase subunit a
MRQRLGVFFAGLLLTLFGSEALAAGGGATFINYYHIILSSFGMDEHHIIEWQATAGALLSFVILLFVGLRYKAKVDAAEDHVEPDGKFSLRTVVEMVLEFVCDLGKSLIGAHQYEKFLPILCGLFLFIFVSNLTGLVPGFVPSTESINTNLAMGLSVFLVYNYAGIKEHGAHYIKQFLGPVLFLMPLMVVIELVAHLARPVSLSLRLYGNIFGDHLVLSVFTGLTYLVLPSFLLFFGLLVASLQSFVFTLLSGIYIAMAISHDH